MLSPWQSRHGVLSIKGEKTMNNPQTSLSQLRANLDKVKAAAQVMIDAGVPAEALIKTQNKVNAMEREMRVAQYEADSHDALTQALKLARGYNSDLFRYQSLKLEDKGSGVVAHWIVRDNSEDEKIKFVDAPEKSATDKRAVCDLATVDSAALMAELERRESETQAG